MIQEIIQNRRAVPAKFMREKEVDRVMIEQLLESANWAPTHKHTEPWRFRVYRGEAKKKLATEMYTALQERIKEGHAINAQKAEQFKINLERVPVAIAIVLERDAAGRIPEWEEVAAVAMAVQNMWLTVTEIGLGGFWASPAFLPVVQNIMNLAPNQKLLGFFYVGHIPMEYPSPGRGNIEKKVQWFE